MSNDVTEQFREGFASRQVVSTAAAHGLIGLLAWKEKQQTRQDRKNNVNMPVSKHVNTVLQQEYEFLNWAVDHIDELDLERLSLTVGIAKTLETLAGHAHFDMKGVNGAYHTDQPDSKSRPIDRQVGIVIDNIRRHGVTIEHDHDDHHLFEHPKNRLFQFNNFFRPENTLHPVKLNKDYVTDGVLYMTGLHGELYAHLSRALHASGHMDRLTLHPATAKLLDAMNNSQQGVFVNREPNKRAPSIYLMPSN